MAPPKKQNQKTRGIRKYAAILATQNNRLIQTVNALKDLVLQERQNGEAGRRLAEERHNLVKRHLANVNKTLNLIAPPSPIIKTHVALISGPEPDEWYILQQEKSKYYKSVVSFLKRTSFSRVIKEWKNIDPASDVVALAREELRSMCADDDSGIE